MIDIRRQGPRTRPGGRLSHVALLWKLWRAPERGGAGRRSMSELWGADPACAGFHRAYPARVPASERRSRRQSPNARMASQRSRYRPVSAVRVAGRRAACRARAASWLSGDPRALRVLKQRLFCGLKLLVTDHFGRCGDRDRHAPRDAAALRFTWSLAYSWPAAYAVRVAYCDAGSRDPRRQIGPNLVCG